MKPSGTANTLGNAEAGAVGHGLGHNDPMASDHGWISYVGGGDNSHLTDDQRRFMEERMRERREAQGRLLCVVQVQVYENAAVPQVNLPHDAAMTVGETSQAEIAQAVARARDQLARWR